MRVYVLYSKVVDRPLRLDAFHTKERAVEEFLVAIGILREVDPVGFDPDNYAKAAGFREPVIGEVWSYIDDRQVVVLKSIDSKG